MILKQKDVNASDDSGTVGLYEAVQHDNLALVRLFLSHPDINIDATNKEGNTPLSKSIYLANIEIIKCLLDPQTCNISIDYSLTKKNEKNITGKQKQLQQYHKGANPNGGLPMLAAANLGSTSVMKLLYKYGANINSMSKPLERTPLMCAMMGYHYDAMEWLIQNGADMTHKDKRGETCATIACRLNTKVMQILLKYNCDFSIIDETTKQTPFQMTVTRQNMQVQDLLFRHFLKKYHNEPEKIGSILDEYAFENGGTAFHIAVQNLSPQCVHYLTQINANPTLRDDKGNILPHKYLFYLFFFFFVFFFFGMIVVK